MVEAILNVRHFPDDADYMFASCQSLHHSNGACHSTKNFHKEVEIAAGIVPDDKADRR
jgi:hypothetical protein